jgi:hypothetical protein
MKTVEVDDANMSLAEYARKVGEEPFVVTDHGRFATACVLPD